jgi:hypothetical protein
LCILVSRNKYSSTDMTFFSAPFVLSLLAPKVSRT